MCAKWTWTHLSFGPHEWGADIADLLIPQFVHNVTVYFYIRGVLSENNSFNFTSCLNIAAC